MDLGANYTYEVLSDGSTPTFFGVVAGARYYHEIGRGWTLTGQGYYTLGLEGTDNQQFNWRVELRKALETSISFGFRLEDDYTGHPVSGTERNDLRITFIVGYIL